MKYLFSLTCLLILAASILALPSSLSAEEPQDSNFEIVKSFQLTVPATYKHSTQLKTFAEKYKAKFFPDLYDGDQAIKVYYDEINDNNYSEVEHQLVPGKTYTVKIARFRFWGTSGDKTRASRSSLLTFMDSQKALFVGAQGLTLAWEQNKTAFYWPENDGYSRGVFSFSSHDLSLGGSNLSEVSTRQLYSTSSIQANVRGRTYMFEPWPFLDDQGQVWRGRGYFLFFCEN